MLILQSRQRYSDKSVFASFPKDLGKGPEEAGQFNAFIWYLAVQQGQSLWLVM
jgi:hypothetical protein